MHGTLTLDGPGLVSARMENGAHIDAAISPGSDIAGIEIEVTNLVVHLGEQPSYRGAQTLSPSMRPGQLRDFLTVVAAKTGAPLFNERDWRNMVHALNCALDSIAESVNKGEVDSADTIYSVGAFGTLKAQIEEALLRG